ncbi:response regulator [Geomonas sp. RF6]|uniref:response regulator n=1 Tax=Geomonas sp. RF6 TaxID=2897342 RepID=UPI001E48A639|nr:response regulator [Geomonas sp. RF6]UFS71692.1 response regulator [Geomonas sp. RF6]
MKLPHRDLSRDSMLIVEDDPITRDALQRALSRRYPHLALDFADNGARGVELFKGVRPEIVLTDLKMPKMSGLQMAQEIRLLSPQAHIIVLSAHTEVEQLILSISLGISRYVLKPIVYPQLFQAIDEAMNQIRLNRELKAHQEALAERELRLRQALDSAELGTWEYRVGSGEVVLDERSRAIFGIAPRVPVTYMEILQCVHPVERAQLHEGIKKSVIDADGGTYRKIHRVVGPKGEVRWVALHGRMYRHDEGGRAAGCFVGIARDITYRVHAAEEVKEHEARYRELFSSLQEGFSLHEVVVETHLEYRFVELNATFERMAGIGREYLVGRSLGEVMPELCMVLSSRMDQVARTGVPAEIDCKMRDRYLEIRIYAPDRTHIAIIYTDVTERRKLQEEQEKNERLASLGVLAGGIAHDFNNILTAIGGNITVAQLEVESGGDPTPRLVESQVAIAKAAGLTRQLLTFARGGEPIRKPLDSEPLIREAVSLFLSGTNCKADLDLVPDLWCMDADAAQVQQALNNLILNAVQAMQGGGVISVTATNEEIAVSQRNLAPGRYVKLKIADQGGGIPPDTLPRIFDPYFTTKPTGSGLGLASVFSIVKRHRGDIAVSSEQGVGTCFEILLPAAGPREPAQQGVPASVVPVTARGQILVMDDEASVRSVARRMLKKIGYDVVTCCDGEEAITLYRERLAGGEPFDAVLLDMTVPGGMGGKEAALQIRQLDSNAVIVVSSGYFSEALSEWQSEAAVNGVVAKPYSISQLADELSRALGH